MAKCIPCNGCHPQIKLAIYLIDAWCNYDSLFYDYGIQEHHIWCIVTICLCSPCALTAWSLYKLVHWWSHVRWDLPVFVKPTAGKYLTYSVYVIILIKSCYILVFYDLPFLKSKYCFVWFRICQFWSLLEMLRTRAYYDVINQLFRSWHFGNNNFISDHLLPSWRRFAQINGL